MKLFSDLNKEQVQAVKTTEGRVLILAGAGSGKTRVLTTRMAYLVSECNIAPEQILGLTFTNKAAKEMQERLNHLLTVKVAEKVTLSTFHSFCLQVLRNDIEHIGFTKNFTLYDEKDLERIIKMLARDELDHEGELPSLTGVIEAIREANNKGTGTTQKTGSKWHDEFTQKIYERLGGCLRAYNVLDFDHLLTKTVELFEKCPHILEKYQERYRYIMIDEYQDTNPIQFRLAELLSRKYQNICVVGDDDQAIYGWRGADVTNILNFESDHKIKLEQNYRSHNTILKAANRVIQNNVKRHAKALWSGKGDGEQIQVFVAPSELEEAEAIAARIASLKDRGVPWGEIAILYRSNLLSRELEIALLKQRWNNQGKWEMGIPFEVFGGTEFYERREIKDLLGYLKVIINPLDEEAILRIINLPRRGIGEGALDKLTSKSRSQGIALWNVLKEVHHEQDLPPKTIQSIQQFTSILEETKERFKQQSLADTLKWLIERIDFKKSIFEDVKSEKMRDFKWENVEAFQKSLDHYEKKDTGASLEDFVSGMTLNLQDTHFGKSRNEEKVSLMTFHSAKGLEFDACFLVGVEDHLIPHEKSLNERGLEEERRLMYVAVTRAKKHLTISMTKKRKKMGKEVACRPSRFLYEIPQELFKKVEWHEV